MLMSKEKMEQLKCPVCLSNMKREQKWEEKFNKPNYEDSGVQRFECMNENCNVKWTAWDLKLETK